MKYIALDEFAQKNELVNIWGRTAKDTKGQVRLSPLTLFWQASGIECAIKTRRLFADIECSYKRYRPYVSIRINGKRTRRFAPEKGRSKICLFDADTEDTDGTYSADGTVTNVCILKECQPMAGDSLHKISIHGFYINADEAFSRVFTPVPKRPLFFEFIGDSITCGEGVEDPAAGKEWNPAWQGTRNHFAMLLSERFNADISVLAQSGWGFLCGWNNDPACIIPPVYPYVCSLAKGAQNRDAGAHGLWDFSQRNTDAVIVNLGSNDEYAFRAEPYRDPVSGTEYKLHGSADYARLKKAAKTFIGEIRRNNPRAVIVFCYGMFLTGCTDLFRSAVEEYCAEHTDTRVRFAALSPMTKKTAGAQNHPGPLCHKEAADIIGAVLKDFGL